VVAFDGFMSYWIQYKVLTRSYSTTTAYGILPIHLDLPQVYVEYRFRYESEGSENSDLADHKELLNSNDPLHSSQLSIPSAKFFGTQTAPDLAVQDHP
jgi:hypothetical protein